MNQKERSFAQFTKTQPVLHMTLTLLILTAVVALVLGLVHKKTDSPIEEVQTETLVEAVFQVVPGATSSTPLAGYEFSGSVESAREVFDSANRPLGYAIEVTSGGFGGVIRMLVGISPDGTVTGVTILDMNETPNLGTEVSGEDFLRQFVGRESGFKMGDNPDDVHAISGATVSSNAVRDGVAAAIAAVLQITLGGGVSG